jgi:hypothetical protein
MRSEQTRIKYDQNVINKQAISSTKPLRYHTLAPIETGTQIKKTAVYVDSEPTRLNYYNKLETALHGTSAFMGRGHNEVDKETMLRNSEMSNTMCNRLLTETQFTNTDFFEDKLFDDNDLRATSTRVNVRNNYGVVKNRENKC